MCLIVSEHKTIAFRDKIKDKKSVYVYKLLRRNTEYLYTPYRYKIVTSGWFRAYPRNFDFTPMCKREGSSITDGAIHCYVDMKTALKNMDPDMIVVKCFAYTEDFIAMGLNNDVCFRKISISKSEYKRALKCV